MKKTPKYGLKLDKIKPEDYVFGSVLSAPFEILQPTGDWTAYLPKTEAQNLQNIEPFACVAFSILNCIEILIKRQYGEERNYSDRFLAAISGTKEGGNSPQIVCEFLRKIGVVPQELWSFDQSITSFDAFYAPIPPKLYELAREFNNEFDFKHDYVPNDNESIKKALQSSPLAISVAAWFNRRGEIYYKPVGAQDNHCTTLIKIVDGQYKQVFDSYDSFIKNYDYNAKHSVIKRFYIKKKVIRKSWFMSYIVDWLKTIFA